MLTCQEMTELVTDYLEGQLSMWDRMRFRVHVSMCKHCRAYIDNQMAQIEALGDMPWEPIPQDIHDDLMKSFRSWKK